MPPMIDSLYRLLASFGFKDPLHAPIVHMPIGLVVGALVFFAIAMLLKRERLVLTARHASILAFAFAFPTILFGVFDWIHFYRGALIPAIRIKMGLAASLLILLSLGIILGSEVKLRVPAMAIVYICSFAVAAGLGYFGGSLVYAKGPVVADSPSIGISEARPAPMGGEKGPAGRGIFESNCSACHAGGGNAIVASLPIKGSGRLASLEAFESFVRSPAMPDGKRGDMPPFGEDALEAGQVKELYAFLKAEFK
jgi:uncharacterized membrane protein